jgi:hypothetical protein
MATIAMIIFLTRLNMHVLNDSPILFLADHHDAGFILGVVFWRPSCHDGVGQHASPATAT